MPRLPDPRDKRISELDVVALDGDPALDVRAFAKVRVTMRDGRIIYGRTS